MYILCGGDEGDEFDWEERGEEVVGIEVDLVRYGVIGEEDIGEGDEIDEGIESCVSFSIEFFRFIIRVGLGIKCIIYVNNVICGYIFINFNVWNSININIIVI